MTAANDTSVWIGRETGRQATHAATHASGSAATDVASWRWLRQTCRNQFVHATAGHREAIVGHSSHANITGGGN